MPGILSRAGEHLALPATNNGNVLSGEKGAAPYEAFVFGLCPGRPLYAATYDRLLTHLALFRLEEALARHLPPESYSEIAYGSGGYYCRIVVPLPNDLPDRIAIG